MNTTFSFMKVKVKVPSVQATKTVRVGRGIGLPFLRPRYWRWVWRVSTTPRPLYPRENPYLLYRRLGGTQGRSGRAREISPPPGFDPRTIHPVASRYTDWAILAGSFVRLYYFCTPDLGSFYISDIKLQVLLIATDLLSGDWFFFYPSGTRNAFVLFV